MIYAAISVDFVFDTASSISSQNFKKKLSMKSMLRFLQRLNVLSKIFFVQFSVWTTVPIWINQTKRV